MMLSNKVIATIDKNHMKMHDFLRDAMQLSVRLTSTNHGKMTLERKTTNILLSIGHLFGKYGFQMKTYFMGIDGEHRRDPSWYFNFKVMPHIRTELIGKRLTVEENFKSSFSSSNPYLLEGEAFSQLVKDTSSTKLMSVRGDEHNLHKNTSPSGREDFIAFAVFVDNGVRFFKLEQTEKTTQSEFPFSANEMRLIITNIQSAFRNIDLQKRLEKALDEKEELLQRSKALSLIDPLTRLQNRRGLYDLFVKSIGPRLLRENIKSITAVMMDLDKFKRINEVFSHIVGDEMLTNIGFKIKSYFRDIDVCLRYGGEEFMVLMEDYDNQEGYSRLEAFRKEVEQMKFNLNVPYLKSSSGSLDFVAIVVNLIKHELDQNAAYDPTHESIKKVLDESRIKFWTNEVDVDQLLEITVNAVVANMKDRNGKYFMLDHINLMSQLSSLELKNNIHVGIKNTISIGSEFLDSDRFQGMLEDYIDYSIEELQRILKTEHKSFHDDEFFISLTKDQLAMMAVLRSLMSISDKRLQSAKREGRNRVVDGSKH